MLADCGETIDWAQRYTGRFSDDGSAIEGAWERAEPDGETWEHDFALTYGGSRR